MILKKLIIENFRSYFGKKEFVFGDKLTLILGSNGDGKSTLFEALNWVLTKKATDADKLPDIESLVSAKLFKDLPVNRPEPVRVTLEVKTNTGQMRIIVREFFVEKREDGSMFASKHTHKAYQYVGSVLKERMLSDILEKEGVFPAKIKKFSILQGEERLNIFEDSTVLAELINMYSSVKDLAPYKDLADYVIGKAELAKKNSLDKRATSTQAAKKLLAEIERLKRDEAKLSNLLTEKQEKLRETSKKIDDIAGDLDVIKVIREKKDEIIRLESMIKSKEENDIDINYTTRLLDELWILHGITPILGEYAKKMNAFEYEIQKIRDEHHQKIAEVYAQRKTLKEAKDRLKASIESMPGFMPELESLKFMLQEKRCKYCGTEAPEGSAAYEHIKALFESYQSKLEDSLEEIESKIPSIPPLDLGGNVRMLAEDSRALQRTMESADYSKKIYNAINKNVEAQKILKKAYARIGQLNEEIYNELSNSATGKDLMQYVDDWSDVSRWHEDFGRTEASIVSLNSKLQEIRQELSEKQEKYDNLGSNNKNKQYMEIYKLALLFERSLESLEERTYRNFLEEISARANEYMRRITVDDFRGVIKMEPSNEKKRRGSVDVILRDNRDAIITHPNKSLLTTKCISVILALAEFNQEKQNGNGYPLILDAPTSSFDSGKEKSFYQSISDLSSQCIIMTKSFLFKENEDKGEYVVDKAGLEGIDCPVYRIKKNVEGFDQQDLSTIETIVEPIKNIPL
ncbi:MAG: AAA family ATPase [Bacteroides sp.]|nr:AAA family ATPase [Bacteroides sp.]